MVHKIEGRVFLLGKNGFYNKIVEEMQSSHNIYFLLIFKSNDISKQAIDDLIEKGDQADLKVFRNKKRIISLQEDQPYEKILQTVLDEIVISSKPEQLEEVPQKILALIQQIVESKNDLTKIDFNKSNFKFKCFML